MSKSLVHRDVRAVIDKVMADEGIDFFHFEKRGNNHLSAVYTLPSGRERFYIFAATPSDRRSILNLKAGLRRIIKREKQEDIDIVRDLEKI